jgi:glycosyltransferase involved in cell wall biosynthesis
MKFSLIIPTFNGEVYIEQTIQCALVQSRPFDEIIVLDDNSSDSTVTICKKFENQLSIKINQNGPSGFVNAFNSALRIAKHDYISILHQDDKLDANFLKRAESGFKMFPESSLLYVGCNYIDGNSMEIKPYRNSSNITPKLYAGSEYRLKYIKGVIENNHIHRCPGVIVHRSIIEKGISFRQEAGLIADDDFFYRASNVTDVIGISEQLASYRNHNTSASGMMDDAALCKELCKCYLFQIENYDRNMVNDDSMLRRLYILAEKFIFRLFRYSIKNNDNTGTMLAFKTRQLLLKKDPVFYQDAEKLYHKLLWNFAISRLKHLEKNCESTE